MTSLRLRRIDQNTRETLGQLITEEEQLVCVTLERPDLGNQPTVSRIPSGTYTCQRRGSPHFKCDVFALHDVPGRSNVEIHWGSFVENSEGCILLGTRFTDINQDGVLDQTGSRIAFERFMALMTGIDAFELTIIDPDAEQAVAA